MDIVEQIRAAYARYNARDFGFAVTGFADDIVWAVPPAAGGPFHGRDEVVSFFNGLAQAFGSHTITLDDAVVEGADRAICKITHAFTTHDGRRASLRAMHDWTRHDGMFTAFDEIADTVVFALLTGEVVPAAPVAG